MMARLPLKNASALMRLSKITTLNPRTAAGIIIDMSIYPNSKAVGEWFIVGYYEKSRVLLVIPSLTNTLAINNAFKGNIIGRDGDVLRIHSNITKHHNLVIQSFQHEKSIYTLNIDARIARTIKVA